MKIVSWNCNGSFRTKYKYITELNADIYVIQECESPEVFKDEELKKLTKDGIWEKGANKKGLLIFGKEDIVLELLDWEKYGMRVFVPVVVNNSFTLVGIWTTKPAYIEEMYIWQEVNSDKINKEMVLIGDLNSSAIWDAIHNSRTHSEVVRKFKAKGLESAYHFYFDEKQGEETRPTFFLQKNKNKKFHIDHCFASKDKIDTYEVLDERWLAISDHVPIILNTNDVKKETM
jgi:exonuclease III